LHARLICERKPSIVWRVCVVSKPARSRGALALLCNRSLVEFPDAHLPRQRASRNECVWIPVRTTDNLVVRDAAAAPVPSTSATKNRHEIDHQRQNGTLSRKVIPSPQSKPGTWEIGACGPGLHDPTCPSSTQHRSNDTMLVQRRLVRCAVQTRAHLAGGSSSKMLGESKERAGEVVQAIWRARSPAVTCTISTL
jgi:hypothetical protein